MELVVENAGGQGSRAALSMESAPSLSLCLYIETIEILEESAISTLVVQPIGFSIRSLVVNKYARF